MKKYTILFILGLIYHVSIFAQTIVGRILDHDNQLPLIGATISVDGTKIVTSDDTGFFSVNCQKDSVMIAISYIGYETYSANVACGSELKLSLRSKSNTLDMVEVRAKGNGTTSMLLQPLSNPRLGTTELKRGTGLLLDDAINANIPGVLMERRTFSAGQQFNIRGYGNGARGTNGINSNFDGQGYKVYLNGIPVTDAEGITLMDDIDFGSVGQVDIIKGPSGTLYGQAIAGVVNLQTVKPQPGKTSVGQEVLAGSYGLRRYTTSFQTSRENASLLANYGKQKYDGFMPHTASEKDFANLIGAFSLNAKQDLNVYFGYSNSYDNRNGEITKEQWAVKDYSGNPNYIKNDAHSNVRTFRGGLGHTYRFNNTFSNSTSVFGTGLISNVSSAGGWTDKSSINYGLRSSVDANISLSSNVQLSGKTGIEWQAQNAQTLGYPMVIDSFNPTGYNIIGTLRSNQYTTSKTMALFTQWMLSLPGDLSITAGIGWTKLDITLNDRFYDANNNTPNNPKGTHKPRIFTNDFSGMVSPQIAVNKLVSKNISVYASFSQGYKAPVSSYFFVPLTGQVLTDLKPEKATQYEVGSKGSLSNGKISYQLAGFYTQYKDKMTTIAVPNATNTATSYVYVANAGEQKNMGLEAMVKAVVYESESGIKSITPFINAAYSHFRYGNFKYQQLSGDKKSVVEVDFTDKVVAGVPPLTFNIGVDVMTYAGIYFNATYTHRDKMYYTSDNVNEADSYQLLNAKLGYQHDFGRHLNLHLYFGASNMTGHQNYAMVFLNQLPDAYLPAPYEINFFGGLNLKYNF